MRFGVESEEHSVRSTSKLCGSAEGNGNGALTILDGPVSGRCQSGWCYFPRLLRGFHHERVTTLALMSQTHSTPASSSNFQLLFNNALRTYEKHTKNDLLSHPLAGQLQACDSPSAILDVLHQQVQELNQSRNSHQRLTKWLDPTVDVLYALSETLGEGVSLVCFKTGIRLRCAF